MLNSSSKSLIFNFDNITEKDNNKDWPYRKLVIGPSGSGKTNTPLQSSVICAIISTLRHRENSCARRNGRKQT